MDVGGVNLNRLASAPVGEPKRVEPKRVEQKQVEPEAAAKPEGLHYPDCDEYVPGDKPAEQAEPAPAAKADGKGRQVKRCSTDKVDREIARLRQKQQQLQQKLNQTEDPEQREALQKQLDAVARELQQKDNDAYRRQHAEFS